MLLKIYEENPNPREIQKVVEILEQGGTIIFPTDTIYGIGCSINAPKAIEKLARLKNIPVEKADFSLICHDLSHITDYAKHIDNTTFKLMKKNLPGPFTFILQAGKSVPRIFRDKKKTIGIRVPGNIIIREIVKQFGQPLVTTSVHDDDAVLEYITDPELIHEKYLTHVDLVIDGGYGNNIASTIVDCTGSEPIIIREGATMLLL